MKLFKKLVSVGKSLGVIIDKPYREKLGLKKGAWVEIEIRKAKL